MSSSTARRIARYAEAAYAVIALILAFGLPWPPRGTGMVLFAHWLGTAVLALVIAVRLGRPNRQTWWVAAVLSAYVLFNAAVAIVRLVTPGVGALGRPATAAIAVGALLAVTQGVVAACLYRARDLRDAPSGAVRRR